MAPAAGIAGRGEGRRLVAKPLIDLVHDTRSSNFVQPDERAVGCRNTPGCRPITNRGKRGVMPPFADSITGGLEVRAARISLAQPGLPLVEFGKELLVRRDDGAEVLECHVDGVHTHAEQCALRVDHDSNDHVSPRE